MNAMMQKLVCSKCGKRMWKKNARMIECKLLCSACLFPPTKAGRPA